MKDFRRIDACLVYVLHCRRDIYLHMIKGIQDVIPNELKNLRSHVLRTNLIHACHSICVEVLLEVLQVL